MYAVALGVALMFVTACSPAGAATDEDLAGVAPASLRGADPSEMAIARWTDVRGAVSEKCQEQARSTPFERATQAELRAACGTDVHTYGCTTYTGHVLLGEDANTITAAHELVHVLEQCELGRMSNHQDAALWAGLGGRPRA